MPAKSHSVTLSLRNVTRDFDDDWEEIEPAHIQIWSEASSLIASRTYAHNGCTARVSVNWKPFVDRLSNLYQLRQQAELAEPSYNFDWSPFWEGITIHGEVELEGKNKTSDYHWYPSFFAELYLYEVFTILNLAFPGSCNLFTLTVRTESDEQSREPRLAGAPFDAALLNARTRTGRWPSLQALPLYQVSTWYSSLQLGTKQIADTPVEKLLFAMLHLARTDDYVDAVIWIFYALEALVETRVGESISTLVRRISLLLRFSEDQRAALNKRIRKLYDLRSSVVHGGFKVRHPMAEGVIDRTIDNEADDHIELFHFGFTIVLACLQALIANNWTSIAFEERMVGNDS